MHFKFKPMSKKWFVRKNYARLDGFIWEVANCGTRLAHVWFDSEKDAREYAELVNKRWNA